MLKSWKSETCVIIAEAGLNHNGNFEEALNLIDIAAQAGADFVKFQKRDVKTLATESTLDAPDQRFPSLGSTYREVRRKHEFSTKQYSALIEHAREKAINFMVTPFDLTSFHELEEAGVQNYKVASHGVTNYPLLEALAASGKPVVLSTGMSTIEELDVAVEKLRTGGGNLVAMLHCVSSYPTAFSEVNLRLIPNLADRYGVRVGYSGHELGILPTLAAVAVGASVVERHFTSDKTQEGFDHHMSLSPSELGEMVSGIRQVEEMRGDGKKVVLESERVARAKYRLSMVATRDLSPGERLSAEDFHFRNPGTGIPPAKAAGLLGSTLKKPVRAGELILETDLV